MLRIICLLVLMSGSLYGQTLPDSSLMDPMILAYHPTQPTMADTVGALHQLFRNQRATGGLIIGFGGGALIAIPVIASASTSSSAPSNWYRDAGIFMGSVGMASLIAIPVAVLGVIKLSQHSKGKEEQVIHTYLTEHTIPRRLKRKLRPELFPSQVSMP